MKRKILTISAIILGTVAVIGLMEVGSIQAQDGGDYSPIVQKLVDRFGLDTGEVEEVFDEAKEERRQEMQSHFEEKLDEKVASGKMTEEQRDSFLEKKEEMWGMHEGMDGKKGHHRWGGHFGMMDK